MTYIAQKIEKEDITELIFPANKTKLKTDSEQQKILKKLDNASILGNMHKNKVVITFQDSIGLKKVNTTVWATAKNHIVLKKGVTIPINRIVDISI